MTGSGALVRQYVARHSGSLALAAAASVAIALAELARPFPLSLAVDHLIADSGSGGFELDGGDVELLAGIGLLVLAIAGTSALASYVADIVLRRAGERITHELRTVTHAHLQRLSLGFHDRRHTGDLVTRVTGDVNAVGTLFSESLGTIVQSALLLVGMLAVGVVIDPVLALAAFAVSPILAFVTFRFRRRLRAAARRQRAREGEIASLTAESFAGMRAVKASGSEDFEHGRLARKSEERREASMQTYLIEGRFTGVIDVLGAVGSALVLVVGVLRVASGATSVGELIVMHSYARRMYRPLRDLARQAGRVSRAMARAERVAAVLAEDAVLEERPGAFHGGRASGELTLERVSFSYGDRPVLRDLSLRIRAGERIAVVGESGAGKSTLAALIARFYDPAEGRVVLDGRDARDCSAAWYRDQVGLVLQETVLFSGTVADNIAYGVAAEPGDIVAVAQAAGADAFIDRLPRGYETELGPRGAALSGGERQRIAIARALLRDPAVLLLDEPTSGLDSESEARVLAGLDVLMRGRTTVIITHSPALAACAERIVALDDGRVVREPARRNGAPRRSPNPPAPLDPALPGMATLLDPDAMGVVLQRTLGTRSAPAVRVHYLRYKPRTNLVVHYEVGVPSEWHHATAMIASRDFLARRAGKPENVALAREAAARASAPEPLAYDAAVGAMIQWLPLDIALPALAAPADQLCTALRAGGVQHASPSGEPELLAYKPRKRAVLRLGDHVLKIYAKEADFERAAGGLRAATGARGVTTASFEGSLRALKVTAQRVVDGRQVTDGIGTAAPSGDVIARLHASGATGLAIALPAHQLAAAVTSARLVKTVAPAVSAQVVRLVGRLAESLPDANSLVPSHGDYSPHQLLDVGGDLALIDCDEFCAAPAALDLATYASYLVRGEPHGLHATWDAIDALLNGYGREPDAFRWYLATSILRRAPAPFRRQEDGWPNRVEAMVATAETALAR